MPALAFHLISDGVSVLTIAYAGLASGILLFLPPISLRRAGIKDICLYSGPGHMWQAFVFLALSPDALLGFF